MLTDEKEIMARIRQMGERQRAGLPTVEPKKIKKKKEGTYYSRNREKCLAYQNKYNHEVLGYGVKENKPKRTEEEIKEYYNNASKEYYYANKEKCREYGKKYYWEHRDYFLKKSRERYARVKAERESTMADFSKDSVKQIGVAE